jgi:tripartite-type tricarboxylate transporter receptor subunit TctC
VVSRINADVNEVLKEATVKSALETQGLTVVGGAAADFRRVIDGDVKRWGPVIEKLGIKLD